MARKQAAFVALISIFLSGKNRSITRRPGGKKVWCLCSCAICFSVCVCACICGNMPACTLFSTLILSLAENNYSLFVSCCDGGRTTQEPASFYCFRERTSHCPGRRRRRGEGGDRETIARERWDHYMRMLITPPHIGRLSNHPLFIINLNVVFLTHTSHVSTWRYIISHGFLFQKKPAGIIQFVQTNEKGKWGAHFLVDIAAEKKQAKACTDFKINQTTQWWRQCCLFYKDLWQTRSHTHRRRRPPSRSLNAGIYILYTQTCIRTH